MITEPTLRVVEVAVSSAEAIAVVLALIFTGREFSKWRRQTIATANREAAISLFRTIRILFDTVCQMRIEVNFRDPKDIVADVDKGRLRKLYLDLQTKLMELEVVTGEFHTPLVKPLLDGVAEFTTALLKYNRRLSAGQEVDPELEAIVVPTDERDDWGTTFRVKLNRIQEQLEPLIALK